MQEDEVKKDEELKDEGKVEVDKDKEIEMLKERLSQTEGDKSNLVAEIKDLRQKNAQKVEEIKPEPEVEVDEVQKKIEAALAKKEKENAEKNKQTAEQIFKSKYPEFDPSNDPAGIKYSAFQKELYKFNMTGLNTVEEYSDRLKEVYEFFNRNKKTANDDSMVEHKGSPSSTRSESSIRDNDDSLSQDELNLIKTQGWTKEKYLRLKEKQPDTINQLLSI